MFNPPSPLSLGEETLISPDTISNPSPEQGSPLVSLFLPSFIGTWYGVGASILVSTASAESSGGGAGHLVHFLYPTLEKDGLLSTLLRYVRLKGVRELSAYRGIRMVAVKTNIFGGVRPLLLFPEK